MTATETEQKAAAPAFLQKAQDLSHFHWNERWLPLDTLVTFSRPVRCRGSPDHLRVQA